jgi:hypothetical protein
MFRLEVEADAIVSNYQLDYEGENDIQAKMDTRYNKARH